ncbi:hypothetical protein EG329_006134 [Mollisiaceae sp. DMI_Dod_QoI]|nr:hypothetical protein EG329_006134 [Helotiales sp. DMI_Dod_QoI]
MPPKIERNFLREIVTPPTADIDIVAVHGLNPTNADFHAENTWTADDKNKTIWLSNPDFLPKHLPNARVFLFGYNSNVAFSMSTTGVFEQAANLLDHLERERSSAPSRPLIFLCHSLGGIVVKQALVTAKLTECHRPIFESTCGVMFFGTPHRGGNKANFGGVLASIARFVGGQPGNTFMDALKKDSLFAKTLHQLFKPVAETLLVVSFYETTPTTKMVLNLGIIVDQASATLGFNPAREREIPRDADHAHVCVYDNFNSDEFKQVIFHLHRLRARSILDQATALVEAPNSLTLYSGRDALVQMKFGQNDIANIGGAGRTITWMTAGPRDRSLLEFLDTRSQDLLSRDGIIETAQLQDRWGKNLKLFKQGKKEIFRTEPKDDLDRFTWLMALFYAALEAAVPQSLCHEIMIEFIIGLFDEHSFEEYIRGELPSHIEGWSSIAAVRMINARARSEWLYLEDYGEHQPGHIPATDSENIVRLLYWIAKEKTKEFTTPSSDVYCVAKVLRALGLDLLRTEKADQKGETQYDENHFVVILDTETLPQGNNLTSSKSKRRGMRIPLECMQEAVSPWPRSTHDNQIQEDFLRGMDAGNLNFALECQPEVPHTETTTNRSFTDLYYEVTTMDPIEKNRLNRHLEKVANAYFPFVTKPVAEGLKELGREWSPPAGSYKIQDEIRKNENFLGRLQSFVMGYYYAALKPLINASQLSPSEAFGSWGWNDYQVLSIVADLKWETPPKVPKGAFRCWRYALMKLIAYMFAGAEVEQIRRLDNRATGVVAKLCLLTASMLGEGNSIEEASKFHLLDIDGSCIPHASGIVMSGRRTSVTTEAVSNEMLRPLTDIELQEGEDDFTVHVEPDWRNDKQTSLVVYRHGGRIVQKLSPSDLDAVVTMCAQIPNTSTPNPQQPFALNQTISEEAYLIPLHRFHDARVANQPSPLDLHKPLLVPTQNLPRARTCLKAMFFDSFGYEGHSPAARPQLSRLLDGAEVLYDQETRPIVFP